MKYKRNLYRVADLKPDYLGFIFFPGSPRYMRNRLRPPDLSSLTSSIKKVGVFVNETRENLMRLAKSYQLDVVQLHGRENPGYCKFLQKKGLEVWKAVGLETPFNFDDLEPFEECCSHFLFDKKTVLYGGSGEKFEWDVLNRYRLETPFFLSGGLAPGDVRLIHSISHDRLAGVDLNSGFETGPGVKDIILLETFIKKIKHNYENG